MVDIQCLSFKKRGGGKSKAIRKKVWLENKSRKVLQKDRNKMKIIKRKGVLIFWFVRKKIVIEFRSPIFIWRTIMKKGGKK